MIGYLNGTIAEINPNKIIVDINGVGYEVFTPNPYEFKLDTIDKVFTYHHIREDLDCNKMQQAANHLIGNHDFSSFRSSICQANNPIKTMDKIEIIQKGEDIEVYFSALSYMHHMVRNIMGSLINVGNGFWPPEKMQEILVAKDRRACGPTAPAQGLYFLRVDY